MNTSQTIGPIYQDYASIVAIHDTLSKELVYLIHEKLQDFIKRLAKVWTGKLEAKDVLNGHLYPSEFQMFLGEKKQWRQ